MLGGISPIKIVLSTSMGATVVFSDEEKRLTNEYLTQLLKNRVPYQACLAEAQSMNNLSLPKPS